MQVNYPRTSSRFVVDDPLRLPRADQVPPSPQARLKEALSTPDAYLKNYLEISELTMGTYKHIGRLRFARLIGLELASLYM